MKTLEDLHKIREQARQSMKLREDKYLARIVVAMGTCGVAAGAGDVMLAIRDELDKRGIRDVAVTQTGCKGLCDQEPIIDVAKIGQPMVTYGHVTPEKARTIIAEHIVNNHVAGEWILEAIVK